tara:strand:+ start:268 stop:660 length:393 start_codon:yes stop_codon:yes gene_type:complete
MKPFDYINSINFTKKNLMRGTENDELAEKGYVPYITNKTLSYFTDTLLYANEMNRYHFLDNKLQYEFYLNSIRKKKRFAKWAKADNNDELNMISEYYKISLPKAKDALKILSPEQKQDIRNKLEQGIKND